METKQIIFRDEGELLGGILVDNKYIICGCCGGVIDDLEEIEIVEYCKDWLDISEAIKGY